LLFKAFQFPFQFVTLPLYQTPMSAPDTPVDQIAGIVAGVRDAFNSGISRPMDFRRAQLKSLLRFLDDKKQAINEAMKHDLGRHEQESVLGEIVPGI
jgi:hypothetical protein